jgi:ribulose kinase
LYSIIHHINMNNLLLLRMDSRAADQCMTILHRAKGDPSLQVNSGGEGPLSAEWMIPKAMWIKENEPQTWMKAKYICEKQDYLNFHLTGCMVTSACNVAARWHFNAQKALQYTELLSSHNDAEEIDWQMDNRGRPVSLLEKIELLDLLEKWPSSVLPMGGKIGEGLTAQAAEHLGLNKGVMVVQGGPDAFVGMVSLIRYPGMNKPNSTPLCT